MNHKFTEDELIAKEEELFSLNIAENQDRVKELAKDLRLLYQHIISVVEKGLKRYVF